MVASFDSNKLTDTCGFILGYNVCMRLKNILLFITMMTLCTGCLGFANEKGFTATPVFFTATLPPSITPQMGQQMQAFTPPGPTSSSVEEAITTPVEGITTTQVNVRAGPSTASQSLGMIGPFVKVQIIGRDASGSWYEILYDKSGTGKGWLRAEYAQVNAPAEIPLVETNPGPGSAVSGLVTQKINVRSGPGKEYETLGVLNSNDVIFITGRDPGSVWLQIEFASAPDGKGWIAAEFLQTGNIESLPLIGNAIVEKTTPTDAVPAPRATMALAIPDEDSMQTPLAAATFSPAGPRALQVSGDVSAPNGDAEDWVQFTMYGGLIAIQATCSADTLHIELWSNGRPVDGFSLLCGGRSLVSATMGSIYFLKLSQSQPGYTSYVFNLEVIH
jgi:uncharacterized protein YraI